MEKVFKALSDRSRRSLLDDLFRQDGQSLGALCEGLAMSRQGASKHLRILQDAGLISTVWVGREKRHFLNPVPIQQIAERWISKFAAGKVSAMTALKRALEDKHDE